VRALFKRVRGTRTFLQVGWRLDDGRDGRDSLDEHGIFVCRMRLHRFGRKGFHIWKEVTSAQLCLIPIALVCSIFGLCEAVSHSQSVVNRSNPSITCTPFKVPSGHSARGPVPPVPGGYCSRRLGRGEDRYLATSRGGWGMMLCYAGRSRVVPFPERSREGRDQRDVFESVESSGTWPARINPRNAEPFPNNTRGLGPVNIRSLNVHPDDYRDASFILRGHPTLEMDSTRILGKIANPEAGRARRLPK